jgi:hypothetical protein
MRTKAQREILRRSRFHRTLQFGYVIVPIVLVGLSLLTGQTLQSALLKNLVWIIVLPLFGYVGVPVLNKWETAKLLRANPSLGGTQELVLTVEGISMTTIAGASLIRWSALVRIAETREFFLFYVLPARAYFLPIAAIPNEDLAGVRAFIASHATSPTELAA